MSYRKGIEFKKSQVPFGSGDYYTKGQSFEDLKHLFAEILQNKIHGICFSLYESGQQPGDHISEEQVERRINVLKPYVNSVRSFSCIEGNEFIPIHAKKNGMGTLVGAWLGHDKEKNEQELEALSGLVKDGYVDIAAIGNEVLYRNDLSEQELLDYIYRFKNDHPEVPVGYVDAYYEFSHRPAWAEACDVILTNCYPFWEKCPFEYSFDHMRKMYYEAMHAAKGKKVIITETGWPSQGQSIGGAVPSAEAALKYFINTHLWAMDEGIETFYFTSFDEDWKTGAEGDVGAYWGIWDKHEQLKYM